MKLLKLMIILWIAMPFQGLAREKTIKIATLEWTPYVGKELRDNGFTSEIVRAVFDRMGYSVKIKFMPWATLLKAVEHGKVDAAYPAYYSDERALKFAMTNAFVDGPLYLCKLKNKKIAYHTLEDLKAYKIGVVNGYVNTPEFDSASYLNKKFANSDRLNLLKLLNKRVDMIVVDKYAAMQIVKESIPGAVGKIEFIEPPLDVKPLHLLVSRKIDNSQAIVDDFNKGLEMLTDNGAIKKIMRKYGFE
jgi:polar amino acid transport system substrate-binding protein